MTSTLLFPELAPMQGFDFPEPLSDRYRPRRIADFAGLTEPKRILAGFALNPRNCGFLFTGPAGTGKTSMAFALASEIAGMVHHVTAGNCTVDKIRDLAFSCWYVPPIGYKGHVILIDEVDLARIDAQNALLSFLDGTNTIPDTVWIFTCNSTDRLEPRFMSRNRVLGFSTYAIQSDAARLLEAVWTAEAPQGIPAPNFARIIKEENGNIRAALATLETKLDAVRAA